MRRILGLVGIAAGLALANRAAVAQDEKPAKPEAPAAQAQILLEKALKSEDAHGRAEILFEKTSKPEEAHGTAQFLFEKSLPYRLENVQGTVDFTPDVFVVSTEPNSLGVEVAPVDRVLSDQLNLSEGGLVVTAAPPEAAGSKAGLKLHDVLVKTDGAALKDARSLQARISSSNGKTLVFDVVRRGTPLKVQFNTKTHTLDRFVTKTSNEYRIGVSLAAVDETLRTQLGLPEKVGLVVTQVVVDGPSAKAGVMKHDILTAYNKLDVVSVEQFNQRLQEDKGASIDLKLVRSGKDVVLHVTPEKPAGHKYIKFLTETRFTPEYSYVVDFTRKAPALAKKESPEAQIAAIRKQVAELSKALSSLEASLKPAPAGK